ncbi:hypothetical protein L596_006094 [Steinernema carpocapsae]|uniref:Uncharacterized protein n=1 Tax=Steinernema carpocapsae TaxID=34508 RepID=A0A4U8V127_STECR|nr:hypothetical protein L596_006094 [Steinernema carpocapsae]
MPAPTQARRPRVVRAAVVRRSINYSRVEKIKRKCFGKKKKKMKGDCEEVKKSDYCTPRARWERRRRRRLRRCPFWVNGIAVLIATGSTTGTGGCKKSESKVKTKTLEKIKKRLQNSYSC